jgi:hypothetical protein
MVHVTLPKWLINWFKPVQQRGQQALRAYYPIFYTVLQSLENRTVIGFLHLLFVLDLKVN